MKDITPPQLSQRMKRLFLNCIYTEVHLRGHLPFKIAGKRSLRILQCKNLVHFKNRNNYNLCTANVQLKLCKLS